MKKLLRFSLLLLFAMVSSQSFAQTTVKSFPYTEDFKSGYGSFTATGTFEVNGKSYNVWKSDSKFGAKASAYVNKKNNAATGYLTSPILDLSKATEATLTFKHTGKFFSDMASQAQLLIWEAGSSDTTQLTIEKWMTGKDWNFVGDTIDLKSYLGKKVQVAFKYISTTSASPTWEITPFTVSATIPGETPAEKDTVTYKASEALAILNAGTQTTDVVYVTGIVSQIDEVSTKYGNATYYLSDDGTTNGQLEVYRGKYLNNEKFTSEDQLKVGDQVKILGVLTNYTKNNVTTPEVTKSYIVETNNTVTAIASPKTATSSSDKIYNLAGQRVSKDYKGLVIKNGKKMIQR